MRTHLLLTLASGFALTAQTINFANQHLSVTVDPVKGSYQVLDKRNNRLWRQPDAKQQIQTKLTFCPKASEKPLNLTITHTMHGDATDVTNAADCSARIQLSHTTTHLTIVADVSDDIVIPAKPGADWWHNDSIEFWINDAQYAAYLTDKTSNLIDKNRRTLPNSTAVTTRTPKGYRTTLQASFRDLQIDPSRHAIVYFALGINDADTPGQRQGQIYYPASWKHSQTATFMPLAFPVSSAQKQVALVAFHDVKKVPHGISYIWKRPYLHDLRVTATLPPDQSALVLTVSSLTPDQPMHRKLPDIPGFVLAQENAALAIADYANGHLYPLSMNPFPIYNYPTASDLPFFALTDMDNGRGYGILVDSHADAQVQFTPIILKDGRRTQYPSLTWLPSLGKFSREPRTYRYHFITQGGYVKIAKIWSQWAKRNNLVTTLKEKARHNPNVQRLMGAADIWGGNNLTFVQQAHALGISKLLINSAFDPKHMMIARKYGYLPGRYDVYTDVYDDTKDPTKIGPMAGRIPEDIVKYPDGSKKIAWITYDKKRTSYKRCSKLMLAAAKNYCPQDLKKYPYLARFIDVTPSEGLYECYDPKHPMTRLEKQIHSQNLLRYVGHWGKDCLNLVAGGEHGKWWAAKDLHYLEGMLSGGHYSWPAGYLKRPDNIFHNFRKPDQPTNRFITSYMVYGIGPKYRIPLWDLALHDCISSTYYWGDATDFLITAAPYTIPRKDALCILHAAMPMYWVNRGLWQKDRDFFLKSYFHTSKVHENLGMLEMTDHIVLNKERTLQKTTFSDGTQVIVNLDDILHKITLNKQSYLLPPNGFAVQGPKLHQFLIYKDNQYQSQVRTDDFFFATISSDHVPHPNAPSTLRSMLRVNRLSPTRLTVSIRGENTIPIPQDIIGKHKFIICYKLDDKGNTLDQAIPQQKDGCLLFSEAGNYIIYLDAAAKLPDLRAVNPKLTLNSKKQLQLDVTIQNRGNLTSKPVINIYLDQESPERLLAVINHLVIKPRTNQKITVTPPLLNAAGNHTLIIKANLPKLVDITPLDNICKLPIYVPYNPSQWPLKITRNLPTTTIDSQLEPYDLELDFKPYLKDGLQLNPDSIRALVPDLNGKLVFVPYTQFKPAPDWHPRNNPKGTLSFALDRLASKPVSVTIVAKQKPTFAPQHCGFVKGTEPNSGSFETATYRIEFKNGTISGLAPRNYTPSTQNPLTFTQPPTYGPLDQTTLLVPLNLNLNKAAKPAIPKPGRRLLTLTGQNLQNNQDPRQRNTPPNFIHTIGVSSKETGWSSEEDAVVKDFTLLENGPAKVVLRSQVTLKNNTTYVKIYTLTPGRILVNINLDKPAGFCFSRGFYTMPFDYEDSLGNQRQVFGQLNNGMELAGRCPRITWFAARGEGWAHSCIALSKNISNLTIWDSPRNYGQLGFTFSKHRDINLCYIVHPHQNNFAFAEHDYQRVTQQTKK